MGQCIRWLPFYFFPPLTREGCIGLSACPARLGKLAAKRGEPCERASADDYRELACTSGSPGRQSGRIHSLLFGLVIVDPT